MPREVEDISDFNNAITQDYVVVDFHASWCGSCRRVAPVYEKVSKMFDATFLKVNIDDIDELSDKFSIKSLPTFVFLKDGEEIHRTTGCMVKSDMINTFKIAGLPEKTVSLQLDDDF